MVMPVTCSWLSAAVAVCHFSQAMKDLRRERCVILNGEELALGTDPRLQAFMTTLSNVIRDAYHNANADITAKQQLAQLSELSGYPADTHHPPVLTMVEVENFVAAAACEVLIAASRTMTGGDSFSTVNATFAKPGLVMMTADPKPMPPIDVTVDTVGGMAVRISTVNTYRACHVDLMGERDPEVRVCICVFCSVVAVEPCSLAGVGVDPYQHRRRGEVAVVG